MLAGEGSYFVAVAAHGHGTPAAAARARIIVEQKATVRISANMKMRAGTLGDNLGAGAGDCGEQPIEASFTGDEFDFPGAVLAYKLIVPFGNAQDFVYRLDPFPGYALLSEHSCEDFAQGKAEPPALQEKGFRRLWVGLRQAEKLGAALGGDDVG
jgi:hypothetical protein